MHDDKSTQNVTASSAVTKKDDKSVLERYKGKKNNKGFEKFK